METHPKPVTAFTLSLIGGLIILLGGMLGSFGLLLNARPTEHSA